MSLRDSWTLYEHPPGTKDWSLASYKSIGVFKTEEEVASLIKSLTKPKDMISGAYLCFMRGSTPPIYEDDDNKHGGALTIRIPNETSAGIWSSFVAHIVTDSIFHEKCDIASGIIISPKRGNIIIQVWTKEKVDDDILNPVLSSMLPSEVLYRSHYERL